MMRNVHAFGIGLDASIRAASVGALSQLPDCSRAAFQHRDTALGARNTSHSDPPEVNI
jgi:hypothetical protein